MEKARIVGFRAHPEFRTLIQTVYECGHAYSQELARFSIPRESEIRCAKCLTDVPAEVRGNEFTAVCNQGLMDHPLIGRLVRSLLFHLSQSEKRQFIEQQSRPELQAAVEEARTLLEELGLGFEISAAGSDSEFVDSERAETESQMGKVYYYELPDLSII